MRPLNKSILIMLLPLLFAGGLALADHEGHHKHQDDVRHNDDKAMAFKNNVAYTTACGVCHMAYPPNLLPSGSWKSIMGDLETHFGEAVDIDPESRQEISEYLNSGAADVSSSEVSRKIMKHIGQNSPARITETPYITKKHHDISKAVLSRASIGTLSNCSACHPKADKGDFDDDDAVIPE